MSLIFRISLKSHSGYVLKMFLNFKKSQPDKLGSHKKSFSTVLISYLSRRHPFNEALIEMDPAAPTSLMMLDAEPAGNARKIYVKVHRGFFSFHGTGKIRGHAKPAGTISKAKLRALIFAVSAFVLLIGVFIFVAVGYLIDLFVPST